MIPQGDRPQNNSLYQKCSNSENRVSNEFWYFLKALRNIERVVLDTSCSQLILLGVDF